MRIVLFELPFMCYLSNFYEKGVGKRQQLYFINSQDQFLTGIFESPLVVYNFLRTRLLQLYERFNFQMCNFKAKIWKTFWRRKNPCKLLTMLHTLKFSVVHLNILWIHKSDWKNAKMFPQGYLALILQVFTHSSNCIVSFATGTLLPVLCVSTGWYPHPMRSSWSGECSCSCGVVAVMLLLRPLWQGAS